MKCVGSFLLVACILSAIVCNGEEDKTEIPCLLCEFSQLRPKNPIDISKPPMWIEPCLPSNYSSILKDLFGILFEIDVVKREKILYKSVQEVAQDALNYMPTFQDRWAIFHFHRFFHEMLKKWWDESIPSAFLADYNTTSKVMHAPILLTDKTSHYRMFPALYEWLQRVAVGLEQAVFDSYNYQDPFRKRFLRTFEKLKSVLCELRVLMAVLNITKRPDIDRSVMAFEDRTHLTNQTRLLRDFAILREYSNILEYVENTARLFSLFNNDFSWNKDIIAKQNKEKEEREKKKKGGKNKTISIDPGNVPPW